MIHVVVALSDEARPLVERYRLKLVRETGGFRVFEGESMRLVVSGCGRVAAAGATAWLAARGGEDRASVAGWLNVGVAGHGERAVGESFLAHKIDDAITARSFYPCFTFAPFCETDAVVTDDRPHAEYPHRGACDMEASAFYATANRFATVERVHCLKIISDNTEQPAETLSRELVRDLVGAHLDLVDRCIEALEGLPEREREPEPPGFREASERWHFSVTEQRRLRQLLRRAQALSPPGSDGVPEFDPGAIPGSIPGGRDFLKALDDHLEGLPFDRF